MTISLKGLSRKELLKLRKDVEKAIKDAEAREKQEALKAAEKVVAEYGFSLDEVTEGAPARRSRKGTGTVSPPKYRNPDDPDQTWTGRGRKPNWINDAIARGVPIEDMEI